MRCPRPVWLPLMLVLEACAAEPSLRLGPEQGFGEARRLLVERARLGPVGMKVSGDPGIPIPELERIAARGISGATVRFEGADGVDRQRLLLAFDPSPGPAGPGEADRACAGKLAAEPAAAGGAKRLLAIFCDGIRPVAEIRGMAAGPSRADTERLIWRSTATLFPDDYPQTYGLRLFDWLGVSLGGSFGL